MADETPLPSVLEGQRITKLETIVFGSNGEGLETKVKKDHEMRIRKLEVGHARLAVIAGVGSGIVVTLGSYLIKMIGG
jgi:hypothetical protein